MGATDKYLKTRWIVMVINSWSSLRMFIIITIIGYRIRAPSSLMLSSLKRSRKRVSSSNSLFPIVGDDKIRKVEGDLLHVSTFVKWNGAEYVCSSQFLEIITDDIKIRKAQR